MGRTGAVVGLGGGWTVSDSGHIPSLPAAESCYRGDSLARSAPRSLSIPSPHSIHLQVPLPGGETQTQTACLRTPKGTCSLFSVWQRCLFPSVMKNSKKHPRTHAAEPRGNSSKRRPRDPVMGQGPAWGASSGVRVESFMTEERRSPI